MKETEKQLFTRVWITCIILLFTVCIYGAFGQTKETYSASSYTLKGKWQWNDCIDTSFFTEQYPLARYIAINFTSAAGSSYKEMWFTENTMHWLVMYEDGNTNGSDGGSVNALFADQNGRFYYDGQYYDKGTKNGKECRYFYTDDGYGLGYEAQPLFTSRSKSTYSIIDFGSTAQTPQNANREKVCDSKIFGICIKYKTQISYSDSKEFYDWFIDNATRIEIPITYNANGGTGSMTPGKVEKAGNSYAIKHNGFRAPSGKVFSKWCTKTDGTGTCYDAGTTITVSDDVTLYAIWIDKIVEYTITYNANGGSGTMSSASVNSGSSHTIKSNSFTAPSGKQFLKWCTKTDGTGTCYNAGESITVSNDVTLYAIWVDKIVTYTITYNANGGSGTMSSVSVNSGSSHTIKSNSFTAPSGMQFLKWCTKANGTGACYNAGESITITSNVILYAQWGNVYTITYNANGGTGAPGNQNKYHDVNLTLSSVIPTSPDGSSFKHWSDGTVTYAPGSTFSKNQNTTLYAIYEEKESGKKYTITYSANGGNSAPSPTAHNGKNSGNISLQYPVRYGYTFIGWSKNANCTGETYSRGTAINKIVSKEDITLYACWKMSDSNARCELRTGDNPDTNDKYIVALVVLITSTMCWLYTYFILKKAK